jgi:K(+)-stimulated pyrophosphate-energized sodium pump
VDPQNVHLLFWVAPIGAVVSLVFAWIFYSGMMAANPGSERSREIAGYVKEGAMSYLMAQYRVVGIFFVAAFAFFAFLAFVLKVQSPWTPIAFLTGGFFSGLCGFLGMITATNASNRTAAGAEKSLNDGLIIAFRSGAVMGFVVVGLALADISIWWMILNWVMGAKEVYFKEGFLSLFSINSYHEITTIMLTFGMGASSQALFARVGGGIFTKAADVGADLVGKTEAGIPEDDPRNPAVIADNVGDNVGDVAGMGADLYESYCGSILASAALGASAFQGTPHELAAILLPMTLAGFGIFFSLAGVYMVSTNEDATQKDLMKALNNGINVASLLTAIGSAILVKLMLPEHFKFLACILSGLAAGTIIGWATEYYTSSDYEPTQDVAKQSTTGPATVIIEGMANGMLSTGIPVVTVVFAVLFAFGFAGGFENSSMGLYGIGIAAVGMLSTLGITLATDAYGPIADNAGGNAEMCHMNPEVRKRTDALDALGNTTAATGKGYAIGSAALTAMALLGAYVEEIRVGLLRIFAITNNKLDQYIFIDRKAIPIETATMRDFMEYYDVNLMNPQVIVGVFLGSMLVFVFCAMTMKAVGRAAHEMVDEVRRQFKEIPGLLKGEAGAKADYASCVAISTKGAQKEMLAPSLMAIIVPIGVGLVLGVSGVMGLLMGGMATGFAVAVMMANAGGSWDNAKKYIESGQLGGKGSDCHKATVVGDTVGDPFKDTSGPSLNILIKLMSMVAVVVAGWTVSWGPEIQHFLGFNPTEYRYKENARRLYESQELKLPDIHGKKAGTVDDSFLDEDDRLLGSEEILPEDDEGLLGEDLASDTWTDEPAAPETAPAGDPKPATGGDGFSGIDEGGKKPAAGGFDEGGFDSPKPAGDKPAAGGFDSFDAPAKPAGDKPAAGGFDSFDAPAKPAGDKPAAGGFDSFDAPAKPAGDKPAAGGFDSFDAPAKPADAKPADAKPADVKPAAGGFDALTSPAPTPSPAPAPAVDPKPAAVDTPAAPPAPVADPAPAPAVAPAPAPEPTPDAKPAPGTGSTEPAPKTEEKPAGGGGFDAF